MRRELNKARTREALASAALELFVAKGFEETTADEVAAAAGVSRRTFFRYFPTKEAAFFASQEARLEGFRAHLADPAWGERGFERLRGALLVMADLYTRERPLIAAQQRVIESSRSLQAYELQLDRRWEEAVFEVLLPEGADRAARRRAQVTSGAGVGAVRSALRAWFEEGEGEDLRGFGEEVLGWLEALAP